MHQDNVKPTNKKNLTQTYEKDTLPQPGIRSLAAFSSCTEEKVTPMMEDANTGSSPIKE